MDINDQYEFFRKVKLTEDGYLIVSGSGGVTPEEVEITINGNTYKSVEAPDTENILVKDEDGNEVGSLINGEWIVPNSGSSAPTYFPLTNTSTNPVNGNTGNDDQSYGGQPYTFIPNDGLYFDVVPTNFNNLFRLNSDINDPDISLWDTSNITNISGMFNGCTSFNQDLSGWNVSNVSNMNQMFNGCTSFNQDIGNWDVSNVTAMSNMFQGTTNFNQDLSGWCVTNFTEEPFNFGLNSALTPENMPVWGTCP